MPTKISSNDARQMLIENGWESVLKLEYVFLYRKNGLFFPSAWTNLTMRKQKDNLTPLWDKLMKKVDVREPTSILD